MRAALVERAIDPQALVAEVTDPACGAVSVFLGMVRNNHEGRSVTGIEYTAYAPMATRVMEETLSRASQRFGTGHIVVEHRVGALRVGEVSIAIVAAHPHRQGAMDACRFAIEEIKKTVPIWKLEHYTDGTREWVDPTGATGVGDQTADVSEVVG